MRSPSEQPLDYRDIGGLVRWANGGMDHKLLGIETRDGVAHAIVWDSLSQGPWCERADRFVRVAAPALERAA